MDGVCESVLTAILTLAIFGNRVIGQSGRCDVKHLVLASSNSQKLLTMP